MNLGDYRLIAILGRGGMAEVYLAVRSGNAGFHKLVVIKRLRADLANDQGSGDTYRRLLLDEARLAARLRHPNIVQTFEVGALDGLPFLAMEYLDGQPLSRVLTAVTRDGGRIPLAIAVRIVADILAALAYAHDLADYDGTPLDIVHRDVSPQNIFWTYDGEIKLVDFGVAKFALTTTDTEAGIVKGKVAYMAPEQARAQPVDRRADIFSVGIILWELIAGRRLLRAPTQAASIHRLLFEELPLLTDVDPEVTRVVARALERDLERRYPTANEMRDDLERVLARESPRREELSTFIQTRFVDERGEMAAHIRDALAGGHELVSIAIPDLVSAEDDPGAAATVAEGARPLTQSKNREWSPRWLWALVPAAAVIGGAGLVLFSSSHADRPAASLAPPATVTLPPSPPDLRLCGSNTIGSELAPALVEAFLKRKGATLVDRETSPEHTRLTAHSATGQMIVDIRAAGTATAFEGLLAGTCDLGMASRAINAKEIAALIAKGEGDLSAPATEHVIALDGIAVIVNPNNKLAALDRAQLHDVFTAKITDWSKLGGTAGPITIFARDSKSGTFDTFKSLVLDGDALASTARRFSDSDALADAVAGDPSAVGFIGLAYVRSAKALAVGDPGARAMLPTSFTVTTEDYMLSRRLYFYAPPKPRTQAVTELVSYALSQQGQAVVRSTNFIDLDIALRDGDVCDARCPPGYAKAIAQAKRISLDFRFRTASDDIDSRATRDLDRLVLFLRSYPNATLELLGFSDSAGDPAANLRLSRSRAATIARQLEARGVRARTVEGFGAAMPIASNNLELDRQRNRRVEAWLVLDK